MGHFYNTVRGEGRNKQEAESDAVRQFITENGTRHDVRDVLKPTFIERVAPRGVHYVKNGVQHHDFTMRNVEAPQDQWLEVWEFELHTHA